MGQAKLRAKEIEQLKKRAMIIAPLYPDHSTKNLKVGEWARKESIDADFMIVGTMFHTAVMGPVKVCLMVTKQCQESHAKSALESWWTMAANKGPKFAAWIPLNDIKEMTVSGMDRHGQGVQGQTLAGVLDMAGFNDEFASALREEYFANPEFKTAMNHAGFDSVFN